MSETNHHTWHHIPKYIISQLTYSKAKLQSIADKVADNSDYYEGVLKSNAWEFLYGSEYTVHI